MCLGTLRVLSVVIFLFLKVIQTFLCGFAGWDSKWLCIRNSHRTHSLSLFYLLGHNWSSSHICFSSQFLRLTSLSGSDWQIAFWRTSLVPELYSTIMFIIFWDFLMVQQFFFWSEVKQSMVISNKLIYTSCLMSCRTTKDLGS